MQGVSGFSLGAQAKDTAEYAAEQGWPLPDHLRFRDGEDRAASGADWDLPGLNAMLDAAARREFSVLVVPTVDRFARDMSKALVLEGQLRKHGVRVVYVGTPVEDTAEGRLLLRQMQSFAEYEREKIKFRTMRGRRQKIESGRIAGNGPAPFGYVYTREGPRNRVVGLAIDSATAPTVERVFREALRLSAAQIADRLRAEGVMPPRGYNRRDPANRWAPDIVLRILTHPVYVGRMIYGRGEGRGRAEALNSSDDVGIPVPAIIDRGLWSDVQRALSRRQNARPARKPGDDEWLLRGLLTCGQCGGLMSATWNRIGLSASERAAGQRVGPSLYRRYHCLRSQPSYAERYGVPLCSMRDARAEHVEAAVWGLVAAALIDPDRMREALASARLEHEQASAQREQRTDQLGRDLKRQKSRVERILDELLETPKGTQSYRGLIERQRDTEKVIRHLEGEIASLDTAPAAGLSQGAADELEQFAADVRTGLTVATTTERRWVLEQLRLTAMIKLDPQGVRFGRLNHRFSLELNALIRLHAAHETRWSLHLPAVVTAQSGILRISIESRDRLPGP